MTEQPKRPPFLIMLVFAVIILCMPLGIILAIHYDTPLWLILTAAAFCVFYAG